VASSVSAPVTLTIGLPVQTGQDPLHGASQVARLLSFEGLSYLARDGRPHPRLAEGWQESSDGLTWVIRLRKDAIFHDGSPVNAEAVKQSLLRSIASPERELSPGLADISEIEALNDFEVRIRLKERSTFVLDNLTVAISKVGTDGKQIGTGAFLQVSADAGQVVMTAVSRHYRGRPKIDRIVIKAYPAVRAAWAAMMRGEIDFLYEVGPEAVEFMSDETSVNVFTFLRSYGLGIILNSKRPILSDVRVRRALNYAIDRDAIVKKGLSGHGIAASDSAWPRHWAYDSSAPTFSYDPSRAAALLETTGQNILSGTDGRPPAKLRFTCILPENFAIWERLGLLVQRNLAEIGVDMQLQALSVEEFNRRIGSREFDAVLTEFVVGNSPSRPYFFWHSQSRRNVWGYSNHEMDQALDRIRRASGDDDYRRAFREFQTENIDDPPAIFLALGETARAVTKRFDVVAPPGSDILPTIAEWRLSTEAARMTN
jgi:peptide/nickel transport system substrate-binding protein